MKNRGVLAGEEATRVNDCAAHGVLYSLKPCFALWELAIVICVLFTCRRGLQSTGFAFRPDVERIRRFRKESRLWRHLWRRRWTVRLLGIEHIGGDGLFRTAMKRPDFIPDRTV